jgi:hypothetical protein
MTRKAYLYQRFSSVGQTGNSSIFRQTEAQTAWLRAHPDVEVVETLNDSGLSGYKGEHLKKGELGKLVAAAEAGDVERGSLILVEQFSRFSRLDQTETGKLVDKIWAAGITIVTVRDGSEYSPEKRNDLGHRIRLIVEIDKAHSDSVWRSEKVKASYLSRFKSASEQCTPPRIRKKYWFTKEGKVNEYGSSIKDMFNLYLSGLGQGSILNELKRKYPHLSRFQTMDPGGIGKTLADTKCIGLYKNQIVYEPVVDENTFYQAQEMLKNRSFKGPKAKRIWPLKGLIRCGHCGSGMSIQQSSVKLPLLRCSNKRRKGSGPAGCDSKATFPYIVAHHFLDFYAEPAIITEMSNIERSAEAQQQLREVNSKLSNLKKSFTETKQVFEDLSIEGKSTREVLKIISDVDGKIENLESSKKELLGIINTSERYKISKSILELRADVHKFNLEMRKIGVYFTVKDDAISYSDKVKLQYLFFSRQLQKYVFEVEGKQGSISSKGVTPETLLNPTNLSGRQTDALDRMNDAVVEISSLPADLSMEEGFRIMAKHMDTINDSK